MPGSSISHSRASPRYALLAASPVEGGFGALPWREHSTALVTMWARCFLQSLVKNSAAAQPAPTAEAPLLWVPVARPSSPGFI